MLKSANFNNNNNIFQTALPILQPLRLWNLSNRKNFVDNVENKNKQTKEKKAKRFEESFLLKVGFIEKDNGTKQMVVAGKIFKK